MQSEYNNSIIHQDVNDDDEHIRNDPSRRNNDKCYYRKQSSSSLSVQTTDLNLDTIIPTTSTTMIQQQQQCIIPTMMEYMNVPHIPRNSTMRTSRPQIDRRHFFPSSTASPRSVVMDEEVDMIVSTNATQRRR